MQELQIGGTGEGSMSPEGVRLKSVRRPRARPVPAAQPLIPATGRHVDYGHSALTRIMIPGNASHIGGMRHGRRLKNLSRTRNACAAWCKRSNNNAASADLRAARGILRQACA